VKTTIVKFKSHPEFFFKELSGAKPNTVRMVPTADERFEALDQRTATVIEITNTETKQYFQRVITDISFWNGQFIISWRHVEVKT
jgi:predicted HAD superfamily phosphohydrolase